MCLHSADFIFKYFRNDAPLLSSNRVVVDAAAPLQGHLALTGTPSEMRCAIIHRNWKKALVDSVCRVMWNSNSTDTPVVYYGLSPANLNMTATGVSYTYSEDELCEDFFNATAKYWIDPGMQHGTAGNKLSTNLKNSMAI